jgi:enoyl-CoA hydratase/carnithine racemase
MMKETKPIMLSIDKGIATISLNRPAIRNALDNATIVLFTNYLEQAQLDKNVKIVLLKGEGKDFCSGADLNWMRQAIHLSKEDNKKNALVFRKLLHITEDPSLTILQTEYTSKLIAELRTSKEAQEGLNAFLEKRLPQW